MVATIALERPLLLVGGGKMGGAMLRGWLKRGVTPDQVWVVEPGAAQAADMARSGARVVPEAAKLPSGLAPEVVVVAVKPQMMDQVLPPYRRFATPTAVFLSIAAGKTVASFRAHLGPTAAVVRAMPNTPAAIGRGMVVGWAGGGVSPAQRELCNNLLAAVGEVAWVDDETLMDAVTAVSGSGPAYVFLLIECLAEAARQAGLPDALARKSAMATVAGAAELARVSDEPPATLRQNVTSPGGTTQAALDVLMAQDGLQQLLTRAVAAAARRSRELAN